MEIFHFGRIYKALAILYLISLMYFGLTPLGNPSAAIPYWDKYLHLSAYLSGAFWIAQISLSKKKLVHLFYLFLYSILIEILQKFSGYRFFEWADILANFSGILLGFGLSKLIPNFLKKLDQWAKEKLN